MEKQTKYKTMFSNHDKAKDLCQAAAMSSDLPVLLHRAIEAYEKEDLKPDSVRCLRKAVLFLRAYEKLERQYAGVLNEMAEMSGLDILKIGYE